MTTAILGPDPTETLIGTALRQLSKGVAPSAMEVERVDVKEEPGRRRADGSDRTGAETNEQTADHLAGDGLHGQHPRWWSHHCWHRGRWSHPQAGS